MTASTELTASSTESEIVQFDAALHLAVTAHRGQRDRQGHPQILHVMRVMFQARPYVPRTTAVLHDALEDTSLTVDAIRAVGISEEVIEAVIAITRRSSETYAEYIARLSQNDLAREVKLLDLNDNLSRLGTLPADEQRSLGARYRKAMAFLDGLSRLATRDKP